MNKQQAIRFENPNTKNFDRNIRHAASLGYRCVRLGEMRDERIVLAGSGPSLKTEPVLDRIQEEYNNGAKILACKQAIEFLYQQGFQIAYAASMDPGAHIANPAKIFKSPGTRHYIASSSDPALFEYLKGEDVVIFHSACGLWNELDLYEAYYEHGVCKGGGFNVVNRALTLCMYGEAGYVMMAGTDCGWKKDESFYVDGRLPTVKKMTMKGEIDGVLWNSAPDMIASATSLVRVRRNNPGKIEFIGDTLPHALQDKDDEFLDRVAAVK